MEQGSSGWARSKKANRDSLILKRVVGVWRENVRIFPRLESEFTALRKVQIEGSGGGQRACVGGLSSRSAGGVGGSPVAEHAGTNLTRQ